MFTKSENINNTSQFLKLKVYCHKYCWLEAGQRHMLKQTYLYNVYTSFIYSNTPKQKHGEIRSVAF